MGFQLSASREKKEATSGKQEQKPVEEDLNKAAKIADSPKKVLF